MELEWWRLTLSQGVCFLNASSGRGSVGVCEGSSLSFWGVVLPRSGCVYIQSTMCATLLYFILFGGIGEIVGASWALITSHVGTGVARILVFIISLPSTLNVGGGA